MAVNGAVYGAISNAEIRDMADKLEGLTKEESLDPTKDHSRQVWSAAGLRLLADMRDDLDKRAS